MRRKRKINFPSAEKNFSVIFRTSACANSLRSGGGFYYAKSCQIQFTIIFNFAAEWAIHISYISRMAKKEDLFNSVMQHVFSALFSFNPPLNWGICEAKKNPNVFIYHHPFNLGDGKRIRIRNAMSLLLSRLCMWESAGVEAEREFCMCAQII